MFSYPITIHHIYVSPGHNYFGHKRDQPGTHPTYDVARVKAVAGSGLEGDRFFAVRPDFDGQSTFFSLEVFHLLLAHLGNKELSPAYLRRNFVVEGVPLNQLIGEKFSIRGENGIAVDFLGVRHCHPCRWLDTSCGPGVLKFLKGRGGLRARLLSTGLIQRGAAQLCVSKALALEGITESLHRPRLP